MTYVPASGDRGTLRRYEGWHVWHGRNWLTRKASKYRVQQFVIETVASIEYESAALRAVSLDEAHLLAAGLEVRVRRYVHKVKAGCPKENIDDDELRDGNIKLIVKGLQILHDR